MTTQVGEVRVAAWRTFLFAHATLVRGDRQRPGSGKFSSSRSVQCFASSPQGPVVTSDWESWLEKCSLPEVA